MISSANPFDGHVKTSEGQIVTRKEDEENNPHGLGLKSIKKVAKKYGGKMKVDYNQERFQVNVVLFLG